MPAILSLPHEICTPIVRELLWLPATEVADYIPWSPLASQQQGWLDHPLRAPPPLNKYASLSYEALEGKDVLPLFLRDLIALGKAIPAWRAVCVAAYNEALVLHLTSGKQQRSSPEAMAAARLLVLDASECRHVGTPRVTRLASLAGALTSLALSPACSYLLPTILRSLPRQQGQVKELEVCMSEDGNRTRDERSFASLGAAVQKCIHCHTLRITVPSAHDKFAAWEAPSLQQLLQVAASLPRLRHFTLFTLDFSDRLQLLNPTQWNCQLESVVVVEQDQPAPPATWLENLFGPHAATLVVLDYSYMKSTPLREQAPFVPLRQPMPEFTSLSHFRFFSASYHSALAQHLDLFLSPLESAPISHLSFTARVPRQQVRSLVEAKASTLKWLHLVDHLDTPVPGHEEPALRRYGQTLEIQGVHSLLEFSNSGKRRIVWSSKREWEMERAIKAARKTG